MIIYFFVFFVVSVAAFIESVFISKNLNVLERNKISSFINFFEIVLLILVSGTRLIGGSDYLWYENAYNSTPILSDFVSNPDSTSNVFWTSTLDYGYLLICSFFRMLGFSFQQFCLAEASFFYFCLYFGLRKYCNNFSIVLLFFLAKLFFYDTFISMRQSITIAVFFLTLPLIEKKKVVKYVLISLLCFIVHAGSVILFAVYFFTNLSISKRRYRNWILFFLPFAVLNAFKLNILDLLSPIISAIFSISSSRWALKASGYLIGDSEGLSFFYILEYLIVAFLLYINYDKLNKTDDREYTEEIVLEGFDIYKVEENEQKINLTIKMFMFLWPIITVFGSASIITREKDYFILSYGLLVCYFSHIGEKKYNYLYWLGSVLLCAFEFFRYILLFDNGGLIPYESWFFI